MSDAVRKRLITQVRRGSYLITPNDEELYDLIQVEANNLCWLLTGDAVQRSDLSDYFDGLSIYRCFVQTTIELDGKSYSLFDVKG